MVRDSQVANTSKYAGSYEWGGVYGTKMFIDPARQLSVVIMTNTALTGLLGEFPSLVTEAIYEALPVQATYIQHADRKTPTIAPCQARPSVSALTVLPKQQRALALTRHENNCSLKT